MKTKYHYFYKITNLINNHFYYGVHNTNNLNDGYMGSGKKLQFAYQKYGIENFKKEILKFFETDKEAFKYESEIVTEILINDNNCYNVNLGGNGGWNYINDNLVIVRDKNNNVFCVDKNDQRYLSGELKHFHTGKIIVKDKNNYSFAIDKNDQRYLSGELVGITKNFLNAKDNKGNIFFISKDDPRYLSGELKFFWTGKKHSQETKDKIGRKNSINQMGQKNSQYGTCWIHNLNEKKSIIIQKEQLNDYIKLGWIKGRKMKF